MRWQKNIAIQDVYLRILIFAAGGRITSGPPDGRYRAFGLVNDGVS